MIEPQQNFLVQLYANDTFLKIKESLTEDMIFAQNYNNLVKEQKTLMDEQFNDLAKWRARQKEKELQH